MGDYAMFPNSLSYNHPQHPHNKKSRSAEFASGAGTCDYCGEKGHDYSAHPEAVRDVQQWQKQQHAEEFPFGDHHEEY